MIDFDQLNRDPGLYIHFPFCKTRCHYCDFHTSAHFNPDDIDRYLNCLVLETAMVAGPWQGFDTVYFGGGTPSLISWKQFTGLVDSLNRVIPLEKCSEITIEANPGDIQLDKLRTWQASGVTRVSLGIQALDDSTLNLLGRRHDTKTARQAIDLIRKEGFELSIDLIFGYPGHKPDSWKQTLEHVLQIQPEHLSCYQLTIESGTVMKKWIDAGELSPLEIDLEAELFHITHNCLTDAGYLHYEVSNFSASSETIARHNTKYWIHAPYLGLGVAAHSFHDNIRRSNLTNRLQYCQSIEAGEKPVKICEKLDQQDILAEKIFMGLRTMWGIDDTIINWSEAGKAHIGTYIKSGWLCRENGRLIPTPEGLAVADYMAVGLIAETRR